MAEEKKKLDTTDGNVSLMCIYCNSNKIPIAQIEDHNVIIAREKYGNANLTVYYYYDEFFTISDVSFDLTNVFETYFKDDFFDYYGFLASVSTICDRGVLFSSIETTEGLTISGNSYKELGDREVINVNLTRSSYYGNRYSHFTCALIDVFNAMNEIAEKDIKVLDQKKMEKQIGNPPKSPVVYLLLGLGIAGIGCIISLFFKFNWLFLLLGIAGIIAGGVGLLINGFLMVENDDYKAEKGLFEDRCVATHSKYE